MAVDVSELARKAAGVCYETWGTCYRSAAELREMWASFIRAAMQPLVEERDRLARRFTAPVVCMCGSTRFKQAWISENARLTDEGFIVLAVGLWGHHEQVFPTDTQKALLDELHKRKIDLCDWVWVLDVGGYIGSSTRSEIKYAMRLGKPVRYLSVEFAGYVEPVDAVAADRDQLAAELQSSHEIQAAEKQILVAEIEKNCRLEAAAGALRETLKPLVMMLDSDARLNRPDEWACAGITYGNLRRISAALLPTAGEALLAEVAALRKTLVRIRDADYSGLATWLDDELSLLRELARESLQATTAGATLLARLAKAEAEAGAKDDALRFINAVLGEGGSRGRPMDLIDKRTWKVWCAKFTAAFSPAAGAAPLSAQPQGKPVPNTGESAVTGQVEHSAGATLLARLEKAEAASGRIEHALCMILMWCQTSGEPYDGFRFREEVIKARKMLNHAGPHDDHARANELHAAIAAKDPRP